MDLWQKGARPITNAVSWGSCLEKQGLGTHGLGKQCLQNMVSWFETGPGTTELG